MYIRGREWASEEWEVVQGSTGTGKVGKASSRATPLEAVPDRGQGVGDIDRWIGIC